METDPKPVCLVCGHPGHTMKLEGATICTPGACPRCFLGKGIREDPP